MTSDSLAAWLAGIFGADRLLLIKSCGLKAPVSAQDLAADKIVDPCFRVLPRKAMRRSGSLVPGSLAGALCLLQCGGMPAQNSRLPNRIVEL